MEHISNRQEGKAAPQTAPLNIAHFSPSPDASHELSPNFVNFLKEKNQEHLLAHLKGLPGHRQEKMQRQLLSYPWEELSKIYERPSLTHVSSAELIRLQEREKLIRSGVSELGREAYLRGAVGVLMVAGGQGTRLGFSGPKGCYPLMPLSQHSMFEVHARKVSATSRRTGKPVPFYIMTSEATDEETRVFFRLNNFFGLDPALVHFFTQGMVPTMDKMGRIMLNDTGDILENPDGHGGCLRALFKNGLVRQMLKDGIEDLVVVQVDNVLCPVWDPLAVGLRRSTGSDMITKVMGKVSPDEKVGSLVKIDGKDSIVEYSEITEEQKKAVAPDGSPLFGMGSPMMLVLGTSFLDRLERTDPCLPYHLSAEKEVTALINGNIERAKCVKREKFLFDLLPVAKNIGLEIDRAHEFAPVKGLSGADSVETARPIISREYARWLELAGIQVALGPGQHIEIDPLVADTPEALLVNRHLLPMIKCLKEPLLLSYD